MRIILLSGGSGRRLWPISNNNRSKQFLQWLKAPSGANESMIQRVWRQLEAAGLAADTVITASHTQRELLRSQLGHDVDILVEPERRDTFPAIALASAYLYSIEKVHPEEIIVVQPVDSFVDNDFFHKINELPAILQENDRNLALIGVKPTYPSTKYGYIIPASSNQEAGASNCLRVSHFKEKPTVAEAEELIRQQALWNSGVVGFKLQYVLDLIQTAGLSINYKKLFQQYAELPKISFDYAVIEKEKRITVIPYTGDWKDLGTWNTLTEQMSDVQTGYGIISQDSTNTHLMNELDIPIVILGLEGIVVAASSEGILIADKKASWRLKELLAELFKAE
jgi:mannose-1-phosphate guanylyltransferase